MINETNKKDRKCQKQVRYIANKLGHVEVAENVFRTETGKTYHYNVGHKILVINGGVRRELIRHYNDFESAVLAACQPGPRARVRV